MEQEVLAEASLQDEVAHLVSDLDQVLRSDAPTSSYELFADHRPSSERLRDLLQLVLVEDVTAGETSQSSTVEERLALHRAECFEALLQTILKVSEDNQLCKSLTSFGDRLLDLGFEQVNEARRLVAAATTSSIARKLLYVFATRTDSLPVFTFDLARGGYASLEFPELNQPFPGIDGSQGYTLMFWMRVDRFDDACHTTLFGACDPSHTCFFLLYLDRKHHSLILQTSVSSSQPSVRFRDVSFVQHKLYHIALVHRKSEREAPGKALLYVDGVLREQARCSLPERPPPPIPTGKGSALEKHPAAQVQAFFGTPRDLSASSKPQTLYSKWSLASGHLINDTLVGDLVFMYYQLGPAYRGNFQDSLGSFLSYQASTNVNLRSEQRDKKNDVPSILPELTKSPGKLLNPEPVFVLSVSPAFARQMQSSQSEAQPILQSRILSGLAPADRLALNAAVPSSRKALTKQAGSGTFRGGVVLNNSLSLQDCCWRLAGSIPIALHFVANATTMEELVDATNFCFKLCKHDWRNSEAFERSSGFGVLSWLLQQKALPSGQGGAPHHASSTVSTLNAGQNIHSQSPSLLRAVLEASTVGNENEEALLVNPLAYRMLVTDNDLWQHTGSGTQDMLYNNLLALTSKSKHKDFNTRRLLQMRLPKRLIEILKTCSVGSKACALLLQIFHALLDHSAHADTLRSIALYITYALRGASQMRTTTEHESVDLPQPERGLHALQMLHSFFCQTPRLDRLQKLTRSVTSKWLLYLIGTNDDQVVSLALDLLTRTLLSSSDDLRQRFVAKSGPLILARNVRSRWHSSNVWVSVLTLFFGIDTEQMHVESLDDFGEWLASCSPHPTSRIVCPYAWQTIAAMLAEGLSCLYKDPTPSSNDARSGTRPTTSQQDTFLYAISLLAALHDHLPDFRHFLASSEGFTSLLHALHHGRAKTSESQPSAEEKFSNHATEEAQSSDTTLKAPSFLISHRRRRASEFVVLPPQGAEAYRGLNYSRPLAPRELAQSSNLLESPPFKAVYQILESVAVKQILHHKDFLGLGLFLKAPNIGSSLFCGVNSAILSHIIGTLHDIASTDTSMYHQPQSLINLTRFTGQCIDAVKEGWFRDETRSLLRFLAAIVGRLEDRDVRTLKSVRLCSQSIIQMRQCFHDLAFFELSLSLQSLRLSGTPTSEVENQSRAAENDQDPAAERDALAILCRTNIIAFAVSDAEDRVLGDGPSSHRTVAALLFLVYEHISHGPRATADNAVRLIRHIASANPVEARSCFKDVREADQADLGALLISTVLNNGDESALNYAFSNRISLDEAFSKGPRTAFESVLRASDRRTHEQSEQRMIKREQRLHKAHLQQFEEQHSLTEYHIGLRKWTENIYYSESYASARRRQDRDVNASHFATILDTNARSFDKLIRVQPETFRTKWALDEVEGRNRMRIRLGQAKDASDLKYQPKRSGRSSTLPNGTGRPSIPDRRRSNTVSLSMATQTSGSPKGHHRLPAAGQETATSSFEAPGSDVVVTPGMDLEEGETSEDKNRKVMRSLRQGEQVIGVYNVSRVRGLEAFEGLFIVGEKALYLIDDMFQRADGEVVITSDAPFEERDPYVSMISGRNLQRRPGSTSDAAPSAKHWSWKSVISVSKRKFLLRAVALEIFLEDGRSYLLTSPTAELRDRLFSTLRERSPALQSNAITSSEPRSWRMELLINPREPASTMTGRFANAFNLGTSVMATAKWAKGEMSNFQYLMLINTLAGRTFNDLTQYPVFPWVLADYTSDELDLTNPRTFRDLSRPMGCQRAERETAFRDRYRAFLDMSDEGTPAFHYGTHYSTAMIVSSYLIRLQPYVDSYLLLQGGSFDHADRLFFSIEKAWSSASQANMTDVRELTPEFFYLPDMFRNINGYDFGRRDATGDLVNDVQLPPWAKGDPKIFVAKHREALESPFVSDSLHQWIDLVFGFKQRGEAAIEATNVFHHLSYQGAIDLDQIDDQRERMATIGIIHNFGQTPQQIFLKPHVRREDTVIAAPRLHRSIGKIATRPISIFEYHDAIAEIELNNATKYQRLTCAGPHRAFMHPNYSMTMDWGFVDGSVRFWNPDTKKPAGIFEQLHQDDVTAAMFAGTVLVTASRDCTVGLWHVSPKSEPVGLHLASFLFGHRSPIVALAVSIVLSVVASADSTGRVLLWDLSTYQMIQEMDVHDEVKTIKINSTIGHVAVLCKTRLKLYTVNCALILDQDIAMGPEDALYCCAFYEAGGDDWIGTELIFTGHRRGIANIWKVCYDSRGQWQLLLLKQLQHMEYPGLKSNKPGNAVTAICPTDACVYTGDEAGRVFEWRAAR